MKVIQPNCRVQFTARDIDFVVQVLRSKRGAEATLVSLLSDPESRDLILDDETLFHALLEQRGCLNVSEHFYFYILVRNVLKRSGMDDRNVADYVAELLSVFSRMENTRCVAPGHPHPLDYFFEMVEALQTADDRTKFCIQAHIGNHSLFLSGVFPERIRYRAEHRGAPGLSYYEALGRASYRVASDHQLAHKFELVRIFNTLSECFEPTRRALNDLADRVFSLSDPEISPVFLRESLN